MLDLGAGQFPQIIGLQFPNDLARCRPQHWLIIYYTN